MGCVTPSRLVSEKKNVKLSSLTATTLHSHRIHSINGWNGIVWFVSCLNIIRMRAPMSAFASHVFRIQCSQRFIFTYLIFSIVNLLKQVFFFCTLKHRIYLYLMKKILIIYLMIQLQCILHFNAAHIHDMSNSCFVIVSYARCLLLYGNCCVYGFSVCFSFITFKTCSYATPTSFANLKETSEYQINK